jgi:serine/threonine protein phosphatase PrpC
MGELAISRALGDADFKMKGVEWNQQLVMAAPEQHTGTLDEQCEFFIIACDGLVSQSPRSPTASLFSSFVYVYLCQLFL